MRGGVVAVPLLLAAWCASLSADLGKPDLHALCRVTLKDGTIIDGAILAAKGGYQRYWDVNGFYITARTSSSDEGFKRAELFDLDFRALEPWTGRKLHANSSSSSPNIADSNPKAYYLEDITSQAWINGERKVDECLIPEHSGEVQILSRTITHSFVYRLLDSVPVFTEIPDVVFLDRRVMDSLSESLEMTPVRPKLIPVKEIQKFELVTEPSQSWLASIEKKTTWLTNEISKQEGWEYQLPTWYHEIVKTPEYFQPEFKPWDF